VISLPLFWVLVFELFIILAVEDGEHVICCQQVEPIHDVLLIDGVKPVLLPVDLQDFSHVMVIRHLSTKRIRCFK
jgi:hypothetical protein